MTELLSAMRMLQCSDSAFPSGNFAFSNGLETLVAEDRVTGAADIADLMQFQLLPRWLEFDRWFVVTAHRCEGDIDALIRLDHDCHIQNSTEKLAAASRRVGRALLRVHTRLDTPGAKAFLECIGHGETARSSGYEPVVQGLIGHGAGLDQGQTELGALHTFFTATLSAAVRLGGLTALDAQRVLADLAKPAAEGLALPIAAFAFSFAPLPEIATQRNPPGNTKLFAS